MHSRTSPMSIALGMGQDPFTFLGLPEKYVVDQKALEVRYFELQRLLHPDRYANATAQEQRLAHAKTTLLNDAYRILKEPWRRACHLARAGGLDPDKDGSVEPAFLAEVMEAHERILAASTEERATIASEYRAKQAANQNALEALFARRDEGGVDLRAAGTEALALVHRQKYLANLIEGATR